ncbi:MAG: hypothetical protein HY319_04880, partial [Armatimonadetes bacterium]|nr:hypothetical protein [Armatimonadota bacterium]
DQVDQRLDEHSRRFDQVDQRLDEHSRRFDQVDQRLDEHSQRFDQVDQRLDEHSQRFDQLDQRLDSIEDAQIFMMGKMDELYQKMETSQAENRRFMEMLVESHRAEMQTLGEAFRGHGARLDDHETRIHALEQSA